MIPVPKLLGQRGDSEILCYANTTLIQERNRSIPRYDGNASMRTGSSPCMTPKNALRPGGASITRVALTGRSKIERQRNLPRRSRRIISASSWSPLETLPRDGTEIEGRPTGRCLRFLRPTFARGEHWTCTSGKRKRKTSYRTMNFKLKPIFLLIPNVYPLFSG